MKKFFMRVFFVLFMPLIALVMMGKQNYNTGKKIGFWSCMVDMWHMCWED